MKKIINVMLIFCLFLTSISHVGANEYFDQNENVKIYETTDNLYHSLKTEYIYYLNHSYLDSYKEEIEDVKNRIIEYQEYIKSLQAKSEEELRFLKYDEIMINRLKTEEITEELLYAAAPNVTSQLYAHKTYNSSTNKSQLTITASFYYSNYITGSIFTTHNYAIASFVYDNHGNTPEPGIPTSANGAINYYYVNSNGGISNTTQSITTSNITKDKGCARFNFKSAIEIGDSYGYIDSGSFTIRYYATGNITHVKVSGGYGYRTSALTGFNIVTGIIGGIVSYFSEEYIEAILSILGISGSGTTILGGAEDDFNF